MVAEGVDEEPIESNRRRFEGRAWIFIASYAALYAAFHMAALNGLSISEWTGVEVPLLPTFPLETWNFRIVHIAGALGLGFLLFAARTDFPDEDKFTHLPKARKPARGPAAFLTVMAPFAVPCGKNRFSIG